jgi:hypothetical protein
MRSVGVTSTCQLRIGVVANNVDGSNALSAAYYRLNTPLGRSFIDFDTLIVNNEGVRTFQALSVSDRPVVLRFTSRGACGIEHVVCVTCGVTQMMT